MKQERSLYYAENMDRLMHRDRFFFNNPVFMQGLGLAPIVVAATNLNNALVLGFAVLLLLTPTRVLAALLSRGNYLRFRGVTYAVTAAVLYIGVWFAANALSASASRPVGLYLPLLVVEPIISSGMTAPERARLHGAAQGADHHLRLSAGPVPGGRAARAAGRRRPVRPPGSRPARPAHGAAHLRRLYPHRYPGRPLALDAQPLQTGREYGGERKMTVLRPVLAFFVYAVVAVAAQNAIFTRALGVSRLVKMVDDGSVELLKFGALLIFVQFLSSLLGYFVNRLLAGSSFAYKAAFQPLVLVLCSVVAFFVVLLGVALLGGRIAAKDYVELLPMATFNCCVLGTLLLTTLGGYTLAQTLAFSLGTSVGYVLAVLLVDEGQRKIQNRNLPATFRGLPVTLVYIGILALAIYGVHRPHARHLTICRPALCTL